MIIEKFCKISVIYWGCGGIRSHDRLEGGLGSRGQVVSSVFTVRSTAQHPWRAPVRNESRNRSERVKNFPKETLTCSDLFSLWHILSFLPPQFRVFLGGLQFDGGGGQKSKVFNHEYLVKGSQRGQILLVPYLTK